MKASFAEISVVGCIIMDAERCSGAFDLLTPEMFENDWLSEAFRTCQSLHSRGKQVDIATIEGEMGREHRYALVQCAQQTPSLDGFDDYCAAVMERWRVRELQAESFRLTQCQTSREWAEQARTMLARQEAIENGLQSSTATDFWGSVMSFVDSLVRPSASLKSGMGNFDRVTGGLQRKGFYIIAGRSGMGKTDFSLVLALNMSSKYRVTYCSMEMGKESLMARIASRVAQVDSGKIRDHSLDPEEMQRITEGLSQMRSSTRLVIDEQQGITVEELENKILRQSPDVIFVDHIGLMSHPRRKNVWEGVAETSKRLKQLAMKHNIVVVGLAQETREANGGIKGSDNLVNDADGIFLMKSEPPKTFITGSGWIDAEVVVRKLRDGARGSLKYHWRPQYHEWRAVEERF